LGTEEWADLEIDSGGKPWRAEKTAAPAAVAAAVQDATGWSNDSAACWRFVGDLLAIRRGDEMRALRRKSIRPAVNARIGTLGRGSCRMA
jgi:hypothetical protein